ncbi:MAG: TetR/AcrR family transcriptional regulator [Acidimicrobiia bacterium]|nr:TetR/AcrR family transcriptional regulator [Acidimicrobiia bacterium]
MERRAVDAVLTCLARHGLTKTTLEDVAREAGCGRATLYRYFESKQDLVEVALWSEVDRFSRTLRAAVREVANLEDAIVTTILVSARELTSHAGLRYVLDFEPEVILPHLAFEAADLLLGAAASILAPGLAPYLPADRADRAAEWVARVLLAYLFRPDSSSLTDESDVRALVHELVLPGVAPSSLLSATRG